MPNITTTTAAVFIPEIWLAEVRRALEDNLVFAKLFKVFNHVGKEGDTLHIPDVSDLTANDMSQTGEVVPQAITETEFTMAIDKWKETSFRINDLVAVQSAYDLRSEYTQKAGFAIAKQMETDLANLFDISFAGFDADGTVESDAGAAITRAGILKGVETLDVNNVPQTDRVMIVPPSARNTMLQIDQFTSIDFVNVKATVTKKIGEIFGMDVFVSNLIPSRTITTSKQQVIIGHKDAAVTAKQGTVRIQSQYQVENLAHLIVADSIYGVKEFRTTNAVRLRLNT